MTGALAPPASLVPDHLAAPTGPGEAEPEAWARSLIRGRNRFGVTRIGSITGLDRTGLPIVQAVRPLALTNAVSQGKGLSCEQASISALMEAIEGYAAENIPAGRLRRAAFQSLDPEIHDFYRGWLVNDAPAGWERLDLDWLDGSNLFSQAAIPVPLALVDTVYTVPSPHPRLFPRATTGLAAGRSLRQAVVHACLEVLERDAVAGALGTGRFFERFRSDPPPGGELAELLERIGRAGLVYGFWQAPAAHGLPVYCCHVMEGEGAPELAPLPGEGFGCAFTHEAAMREALLEACQARATAISGAREDVTRRHYPSAHDRVRLDEWRRTLAAPDRRRVVGPEPDIRLDTDGGLGRVLAALLQAGARAAIVVPLYADMAAEIFVVRVVAPPLRLDPRA